MRLAVFTNQFPGPVSTFFARDLHALHLQGIDLDVFSLYPYDPDLWAFVPEAQREFLRQRITIHHATVPTTLAAARPWLSRNFFRTWEEARPILGSAFRFGWRAMAYSTYAVLQARLWATRHSRRFDHILAYWGNFPATCAYVFQRLTDTETPLSVLLHAGTDLYRDQVFLTQKLRYADNILVVCEFNREFLRNLEPTLYPALEGKIHLHHLGLDLAEFPFHRDGRSSDTVVGVGRFDRVKGFADLVRAIHVLTSRGLLARLELIGDGAEADRLRQLVRELRLAEVVRFHGWLPPDATRQAVQHATLLAHPSAELGDAVPTVIKEAMALGTPVVASRIAGIPELLDEGRCGVLVPPRQPEQLAEAIARLLEDEPSREQLARRARERAEALFDLWQNGRRLASILRSSSPAAHWPAHGQE
jgi:glycosyltransferase involved in cell wall biosynthesis